MRLAGPPRASGAAFSPRQSLHRSFDTHRSLRVRATVSKNLLLLLKVRCLKAPPHLVLHAWAVQVSSKRLRPRSRKSEDGLGC